MANHLPDSPAPAVRAVLAFETASEFHALHRYEAARQSARVLRRLSLQSRPARIFPAEEPSNILNLNQCRLKPALQFSVNALVKLVPKKDCRFRTLPNPASASITCSLEHPGGGCCGGGTGPLYCNGAKQQRTDSHK